MEQENYRGSYYPDASTVRAEADREKRLEEIKSGYSSSLDFNRALETARIPLARVPYKGTRE